MDIDIKKKNQLQDSGARGVVDLRALAKDERSVRTSRAPKEKKVFQVVPGGKKYFDVRPQDERFYREEKMSEREVFTPEETREVFAEKPNQIFAGRKDVESAPIFAKKRSAPNSHNFLRAAEKKRLGKNRGAFLVATKTEPLPLQISAARFSSPELSGANIYRKKSLLRFAVSSFMIPAIIFTFSFTQSQFERKGKVLGDSTSAYNDLKSAARYALASDFIMTGENFASANLNFAKARETVDGIGLGIGETIAELPIDTPLSTAQNLTTAGENISLAGKDFSAMLEKVSSESDSKTLLEKISGLEENIKSASEHLESASDNLDKVDVKYIPQNMREKIELAKNTLPPVSSNFQKLAEDYPLISKMLGSEQPQKYLLLFENNSEMRATGGFIGSYGILDIENGKIKNLSIDGIYNPDGQLQEKIVPPMPVQKISSSWSMHDANWFADFPTSAKKIALLYEKTGGATVDGVIAITPETVKKLLAITGPIEMPAYNITITADNFVAETQDQVENLYDQKENRPKQILADLAPVLLEKILRSDANDSKDGIAKLLEIVRIGEESLQEKHILIYHRDEAIESMIKKRGWGGEVIQNERGDYLSVINSNINGYKTDAVIEEKINLETEIQKDGRVVNTVTIKRKHLGGNAEYDWYNRVNADYMRVYVPKGSILLEASGNTVEEYNPPIDYANFKTDADVEAAEKTIKVDSVSGTQVFEEAGKTVFGNWVYVSPQEEVTVVYKYELPFKIDFKSSNQEVDAYSAIIQKQSGSVGSDFKASIKLPEQLKAVWKTEKVQADNSVSEKLSKDMIYALALVRK